MRVTRNIAKVGLTALLGASMLFPGRVQKPLHDGIRQDVATASVKDDDKKAESPEFKRIKEKN